MSTREVGYRELAELAGRLTGRDRWLLRMLHEHTVLTTTQLHRLGWAAGMRQLQARVRTLRGFEVIDGFQPLRPYGYGSEPVHLILGPVGARVLAAETGLTVTDLGYRGRTRAQRVAHRMSLRHDVGVGDLVCDLATTAGVEVVRWWSARRCGRYFGHHTRPDAYLTLTTHPRTSVGRSDTDGIGGQDGQAVGAVGEVGEVGVVGGWWEMFLEYDTGTENLTQLTDKTAGYHALAEQSGVVTPVGVWFTRPGREPSARRALTDALQALPHRERVPILTGAPHTTGHATSVPAGAASGAAGGVGARGRVWLPLRPGAVERVALAALATTRPHPHRQSPAGVEPEIGAQAVGAQDRGGPLPAPYPYPPHRRDRR